MNISRNNAFMGYAFQTLCINIFEMNGFNVRNNVFYTTDNKSGEIDIIVESEQNEVAIVEVKFYRTRNPSKAMLLKVIEQLKKASESIKINNLVLMIATTLNTRLKQELQEAYGVVILDSKNILYLVEKNSKLNQQYRGLVSDLPEQLIEIDEVEEVNFDKIFKNGKYAIKEETIKEDIITEVSGDDLCDELMKIKCGREEFEKFEDKCTEILKYLFSEYLTGWHKQLRTEDELNRYDLICRVKKGNEFWEFLKEEFNSRYIVFEFKNYCEQIKQTQIYTTEKYLFSKALRTVSFMISHKGPSENALKATSGILRESGKLIIHLTTEQVCELLRLKETGSEPSDFLFELVDKFLMTLSK